MAVIRLIEQNVHLGVLPLVACIFVITVVSRYACYYFSRSARHIRNLPVVKGDDDEQLRKSISQAFSKLSKAGRFYKLGATHGDIIIVPPQFMGELKALPDSVATFKDELYDRTIGELTGLGVFEHAFMKTVSGDLSKRVPRLIGDFAEECDFAMRSLMGDGNDSKTITVLPAAQRIIALLNSRIFVGVPVSRNEEWLSRIIVHAHNAFNTSRAVWQYPKRLRKLIAPYTKAFQDMQANKKVIEEMLAPEVAARQKAALVEDDENFDDILSCLIRNSPVDKRDDVQYHAANQLEMSVAGIHTTAQMLTHMIYNLAAYPECVTELRREARETLKPHTTQLRTLVVTKPSLMKCVKLDSFMKETQRHSPLGIIGMNRRINAPSGITLSNGLHIPRGSYTAVNSYHIVQDPSLYPAPEVFDAFRFSRPVSKSTPNDNNNSATKQQFTSVNPEFIAFGYGNHSCPGRFFAAAELKVILIHILLGYDVTLELGQSRPKTVTRGVLQSPNPQGKVVFTPREDAWSLVGGAE